MTISTRSLVSFDAAAACARLNSCCFSGMGLKTAHRLLRKYQTVPKLLQAVRMEGMRVPETYHEDL